MAGASQDHDALISSFVEMTGATPEAVRHMNLDPSTLQLLIL